MKRIFLDTNILLDAALGREHADEALAILSIGESGKVELCASVLTYANIAYILRKHPKEEMYKYLSVLREGINVLPLDAKTFDAALEQEASDFEDMLQYQIALAANCECVVTNNIKHFKEFSALPLYSSTDFVNSFEFGV